VDEFASSPENWIDRAAWLAVWQRRRLEIILGKRAKHGERGDRLEKVGESRMTAAGETCHEGLRKLQGMRVAGETIPPEPL